jgi:metallo-beta-lactamase family protein
MERFVTFNYQREHVIDSNISITFYDAGHVLGSAIIEIQVFEQNTKKILLFSGDLGRKGLPILRDPTYVEKADFVMIESTYGDRLHDPVENMQGDVEQAVNDTVQRGGKIIIPAFSLERTQEIIYLLHLLGDAHRIPEIPIYVDSPLSLNLTQVFQMHPESYDMETYQAFLMHQDNPFGFGKLKFIRSTEESKALNGIEESCIIISSSGMCEAGRIRHHIANNIANPNNTILIIGYQADGTLGRQLVDHVLSVRIFGLDHPVKAEVRVLNSFSAHADKGDIMDWLSHVRGIQKVFLVHGEDDQMIALKEHIQQDLHIENIYMPSRGETIEF